MAFPPEADPPLADKPRRKTSSCLASLAHIKKHPAGVFFNVRGLVDDVRTRIMENKGQIHVPDLRQETVNV